MCRTRGRGLTEHSMWIFFFKVRNERKIFGKNIGPGCSTCCNGDLGENVFGAEVSLESFVVSKDDATNGINKWYGMTTPKEWLEIA